MKSLLLISILASSAWGQALPAYVLGAGGVWDRGATNPWAVDTTVAMLIKGTSFYWWSDLATPVAKGQSGQPIPSTITTGGAYVLTSTPRVSLVLIFMAGLSISPQSVATGGSVVYPAFSGSLGVPVKIGKGNWSVMPYIKALATAVAPAPGTGVTTVISPGVQVQYNFK